MHNNTHRIDCYIPGELYTEIRESPESITQTVVDALTQYLHNQPQENHKGGYDKDLVDLLKSNNQFLQQELERVHNELTATMLTRSSLLQKVIYRLKAHRTNE